MPAEAEDKKSGAAASKRLFFIDMYRGLAVLVMLEGHVINSTLLPALRPTRTFHHVSLFNGMIAPSFIFIAGFAFTLILEKKWDGLVRLEKPFWHHLKRFLFIIAVGFWLHIPTWSFQQMLRMSRDSFLYFLRCDVLQLIGFSLLISLFLTVLIRKKRILLLVHLILAMAIVLITPFLYYIDPREYLPVPFSDYINVKYGALFPLFPWAAYSFLGTVLCAGYLEARKREKEGRFFAILSIVGGVFFVSAFALFYVPWSYYTYADPSRSSPRHFMLKIGFIFLSLSALWLYERIRKPERSALKIVGQESLMVYGLHLVIVYGAAFMPYYISRDVGKVLNYRSALAVTLLLAASMIPCALIWNWAKQRYPLVARIIFYSLCFLYFFRFFTS